ncbi:DUF3108 domain-containing protein [Deferrisoma sp.]
MVHRAVLLWVAACFAASSALALPPPPRLADLVGERLEFRVRWGVIPAARASLEVLPGPGGTVRFRARARTLPYIDTLYPVRNRVDSTVALGSLVPLRYFKRAKEGWGDPREVEVLFDPERGTSRYFRNGNLKKELLVPPGVQDPLSSFYAYRTRPVPDDAPVHLDITDGKKLVTGTVAVLGRETVETPAGRFATVKIEPKIEGIGGIFKKSPGARIFIWLTDDTRRMPVKLQSEVIVGSFTAELTAAHLPPGLAPPHPAPLPPTGGRGR